MENKILLDENKVKYALFWFVDNNPIDSVALSNLNKGAIDKAKDIWQKATKGKEISVKNLSAFNNLSTLLILNNLDENKNDQLKKSNESINDIRTAISLKNQLISSEFFNEFSSIVCKKGGVLSALQAKEFYSETILSLLQTNYSNKDLLSVFEGLDRNICETLNNSIVDQPINKIKSAIKNANDQLEDDNSAGIKIGKQLIKNTLNDLKQVKEILGNDDYQFQSLSDKLANQIMQCGILCYNKTHDDYDYLSSYKYALSIAVDNATVNRAKDCIKHCESEKEANLCSCCNKK